MVCGKASSLLYLKKLMDDLAYFLPPGMAKDRIEAFGSINTHEIKPINHHAIYLKAYMKDMLFRPKRCRQVLLPDGGDGFLAAKPWIWGSQAADGHFESRYHPADCHALICTYQTSANFWYSFCSMLQERPLKQLEGSGNSKYRPVSLVQ